MPALMPMRHAACLMAVAALAACASPAPPPPSPPPAQTVERRHADPPVGAAPPADPPPKETYRLDPAVIQHVIRHGFDGFRACFEEHLTPCPNLQNRVTVRFVIGRDGRVTRAVDAGSELPDRRVVACAARHMATLRFPPPKGGPVTVTYPIMIDPG
jgi:hypothetical protein